MPARWQSSQRPLFVRTVWVNGVRHAILSADDPLLRSSAASSSGGRPGSCSSVGTFTSSSSGSGHRCEENVSCDLEHCLIKLQLVLKSPKSNNVRASSCHRSSARSKQDVVRCCEEHQSRGHDLRDAENNVAPASMIGQYRRPYLPHVFPSSSEDEQEALDDDDSWLFSDVETLLPDLQLNPLSERVLQWLDLSGKTTGILDVGNDSAHVSREKKERERPTSHYYPTPAQPHSPEVPTDRRYASKRILQRQRNVEVSSKVPTVALQSNLETASTNSSIPEEPLFVTAKGLKTIRRRRNAFNANMRAVRDETVRNNSPVGEEDQDTSSVPPQSFQPVPSPAPSTEFVEPPPRSPPSAKLGGIRPQLHIFMPTLPRDRPVLRHQDAADNASEVDSYWSET